MGCISVKSRHKKRMSSTEVKSRGDDVQQLGLGKRGLPEEGSGPQAYSS